MDRRRRCHVVRGLRQAALNEVHARDEMLKHTEIRSDWRTPRIAQPDEVLAKDSQRGGSLCQEAVLRMSGPAQQSCGTLWAELADHVWAIEEIVALLW